MFFPDFFLLVLVLCVWNVACLLSPTHTTDISNASNLILLLDERSEHKVFSRLAGAYSSIYIDEVQDLAGHDIDVLEMLFSGILVRGVCAMSHSNYSIPSAFEAQARSIRNSLRLRRSGSFSRSPSAISSYIPFGIGTVPGTPLEFTTTNRDSPSSSR